MIKIKQLDSCKFSVEGHANYDEPGKDIVCACVSTIKFLIEDTPQCVAYESTSVKGKYYLIIGVPALALGISRFFKSLQAEYEDFVSYE